MQLTHKYTLASTKEGGLGMCSTEHTKIQFNQDK